MILKSKRALSAGLMAVSTGGLAGCVGVDANKHSASEKLTPAAVEAVSPAFAAYTRNDLFGGVWEREALSPRDRSVATVAALIARNQTIDMPFHFDRALDNGVKPGELSEIILHLAFYAGWPNANAAILPAKAAFDARGISADQLPAVSPTLSSLDEVAEAQRERQVSGTFGATAPGVVKYTREALFLNLWLRPDLAPRDRSLVTVTALIASGQVAQIPFHLNRAMDNGLTVAEAGEVLTHLAFYSGWPTVFSALPVVKEVLEKRPK